MQGIQALQSAPWLELGVVLFVGTAVIVGTAALAARWAQSAFWQRTLWQAATLALALLLAVELGGVGRGLARLCFEAKTAPLDVHRVDSADSPSEQPTQPSGDVTSEDPGQDVGDRLLEPDVFAAEAGAAAARHSESDACEFAAEWRFEVGDVVLPWSFEVPAWQPSEEWQAQTATAVVGPAAPEALVGTGADVAASGSQTLPVVEVVDAERSRPQSSAPRIRAVCLGLLVVLWVAGAFGLLVRLAWRHVLLMLFRWRRATPCGMVPTRQVGEMARRVGVRREVAVVQARGLSVPVAFGWLRPTVALPIGFFEEFDAEQQRVMLVHELAHLAAGDAVWLVAADGLCSLLWWHPLVWWSRMRLQDTSEVAADEASLLLPDGPGVLAGCLVALGRRVVRRSRMSWVSINGPGFHSGLGRRVERLLHLGGRPRRAPGWGPAAFARFLLPVLLTLAAVFSTAWVRPQVTPIAGEKTMNVWRTSVSSSVAATVLWMLAGPANDAASASENGVDGPIPAVAGADFDGAGVLLAQRDGERREGDREREEGDRRRGDREGREVERRDGDRPQADREEGAAREGDREHAEGGRDEERRDREHPEARRERDEDRREHEAERREREKERRERAEEEREREEERRQRGEDHQEELAEFEEHLHQMKREREELIHSAEAVHRELKELGEGRPEAAGELRRELQRIEQEVRELDVALHRERMEFGRAQMEGRVEELKRRIHELSEAGHHDQAERLKQEGRRMMAKFEEERRRLDEHGPRIIEGERPRGEPGDLERRLDHIRAAVENLRAAGMHEVAERLAEQAERLMHEHRQRRPEGPPPFEPRPEHMERPPMPEQAMREVEQLRREVHELRQEMRELREHLRRMVERED